MPEEDEVMSRRRYTSSSRYGRNGHGYGRAEGEYEEEDEESLAPIDFGSVALYLPGLQTTLAIVVCCATTIVTSLASVALAVSAVRTATISAVVGAAVVWRPCRLARARGIDMMSDTLRPAVAVYMLALVFEQLVHSCGPVHVGEGLTARHWVYHASTVVMAVGGFWQVLTPRSRTDYPFVLIVVSLVVVSIFTPPPRMGEGPLCEPPAIAGAVERLFRAFLFGTTYCALAYGAAPAHHSVREVALSSVRATAGSIWILSIHRYLMWLAIAQTFIVMWARLRETSSKTIIGSEFPSVASQDMYPDQEAGLEWNEGNEGTAPYTQSEYYDPATSPYETRPQEMAGPLQFSEPTELSCDDDEAPLNPRDGAPYTLSDEEDELPRSAHHHHQHQHQHQHQHHAPPTRAGQEVRVATISPFNAAISAAIVAAQGDPGGAASTSRATNGASEPPLKVLLANPNGRAMQMRERSSFVLPDMARGEDQQQRSTMAAVAARLAREEGPGG